MSRRELPNETSIPSTGAFGVENTLVELWDHGNPIDDERNDALTRVARICGTQIVATNNVHYARPRERALASALAALRAGRSMEELDSWLPGPGLHICVRDTNNNSVSRGFQVR
ncbi:MAG: hypothetical protein R2735_01420 [Microthrixaceae bacterium]